MKRFGSAGHLPAMKHSNGLLRRIAICAALALIAGSAWGQKAEMVGKNRPGTIQDWEQRIKTAEERLRAGDFKKTQKIAEGLVWEMMHTIQSGPGAGPILGETLLLRALGLAGRDKMREALWDWSAACIMNPKLTAAELTAYGPAGEALFKEAEKEGIPRTPNGKPRAASAPKVENEMDRPVKIQGDPPDYPKALHTLCAEGNVVLESIVDEKGYVLAPAVVSSPNPIFTLSVLEAVRAWRFKPANYQGKPAAVYHTLTLGFNIPACRNPAAIAEQGKDNG